MTSHWSFVVSVAPALDALLYPILWIASRELQQNIGEKETERLCSKFYDILDTAAGLIFYDDGSFVTLFKTKHDCFI